MEGMPSDPAQALVAIAIDALIVRLQELRKSVWNETIKLNLISSDSEDARLITEAAIYFKKYLIKKSKEFSEDNASDCLNDAAHLDCIQEMLQSS